MAKNDSCAHARVCLLRVTGAVPSVEFTGGFLSQQRKKKPICHEWTNAQFWKKQKRTQRQQYIKASQFWYYLNRHICITGISGTCSHIF